MEDYILILNKPKNISSFSYIQKIRKEENIKKIGHAGTLDPLAEGMMIVMANGATKFSDYLMKKDKTYLVEMELGYETETLDLEGKKINEYKGEIEINIELLNEVLNKYKGKIKQIPPMYSAIKKDGIKLYQLARSGEKIELESRNVEIYDIYDVEFNNKKIRFRCDVSSGTYIRSLVRDIGRELGYFATMTELFREKVGKFCKKDFNKKITIEEILDYPKLDINEKLYLELKNGMTKILDIKDKKYDSFSFIKVYCNDKFVGLVEIKNKIGYTYYIKRHKYFK
ncbi:tRNA pseudouridine(55) synthase TruB [Pseudostreptobacillus sp.]